MIPTLNHPLGMPYGRHLQYLESTGTQYINTGIAPDFAGGDSVEIRYFAPMYTSPLAPCIFGSRESGIRNGVYLLPISFSPADSEGFSTISYNFTGNNVFTATDAVVKLNDLSFAMPRRVTCGLPIFLFALNNYGTGTYGIYAGMKLYDWKYYRNGTLAQHLIPVLDKSGVPCLYDTVTRTFKYNAGSGTFNYA